jgi:aryl-alcohol dehydrogenase-like predicted oxidoreductase
MKKQSKKSMSRKEFLKKASSGLAALSLSTGCGSRILSGENYQSSPKNRKRILGRTGIEVTPIGCGASRTMEPAIIRAALEAGINFFDTGRSYFNGRNEVMLGETLKGTRRDLIIQSKISLRLRERGEELAGSEVSQKIAQQMQDSLEASLKALQTDYIDIMLLHGQSRTELLHHDAVKDFFSKAKAKGIIRACGFSSHTNHVDLLRDANESSFYDVVMVPYNHKGSYVHSNSGRYSEWDQTALEKELEKAYENQLGIVAMKTCSAGPLALQEGQEPNFTDALKWIIKHDTIATTAVAMANLQEVGEAARAMP